MPEKCHHAFEYTLSTPDEIRGTWTRELVNFCKNHLLWYKMKHELGENEKLHLHIACVLEIASVHKNGGAQTASNFKRFLLKRCPILSEYLANYGSIHSVVCAPMRSSVFIAEYLNKESLWYFEDAPADYQCLPGDLNELRPYFADMQREKQQNPEYDKWEKMYIHEDNIIPATPATVWDFMQYHFHDRNDIKIVADNKKLKERCVALSAHINKEIPDNPFHSAKKQKTYGSESSGFDRICPRCVAKDVDAPNFCGYRQQFCDGCKKY